MKQIEKNTVDAKNQLKNEKSIRFINENGHGKRILFVGNSITRHAPKPVIGWYGDWGMAASSKENDYVHLCITEIKKTDPDAAFCIAQVAKWETAYPNGEEVFPLYESVHNFNADIIIMRCVENIPLDKYKDKEFQKSYLELIDYFNPKNADVILTTSFWESPADKAIAEVGAVRNYPVIRLGDLGNNDAMMAKGLFEHAGVAMHPGDQGMQEIAARILSELTPLL